VFPSGLLSLMISSSCRAPVFPNGRIGISKNKVAYTSYEVIPIRRRVGDD
jgi:hypothetical protein